MARVGRPDLFPRGSWSETRRITGLLRSETVAGVLLIAAALIALVWANSAYASSYFALRGVRVGPSAWHLDLTLEQWAADGLLVIFFFLAGLELKREFVIGDLRDPRRAAVPVVSAVGGMLVPAALFLAVNAGHGTGHGWAIPTATDIAFSLAVLAVISTHLPAGLRTFLLALAIVDDLLAIIVIAVFYTADLSLPYLLFALLPIVVFGVLAQLRLARWWNVVPLALLVWVLVHASGIHTTVAGVVLAFCIPVRPSGRGAGRLARPATADRLEHLLRPISSGFAVPVFALLASGVVLGSASDLLGAVTRPVTLGVAAGLVIGKPVGVLLGAWSTSKVLRAPIDPGSSWLDAVGIALLCGIGFTVSLLIGELAFEDDAALVDQARIGVLCGTITAAVLAAVVLRVRNAHYRRVSEYEEVDADHDGVPDAFQRDRTGQD